MRRVLRRVLPVVVLVAVLAALPGRAAAAPLKAFRDAGLAVRWPVSGSQATVLGGRTYVVGLSPRRTKRLARPATVTLVRLSAAGRPTGAPLLRARKRRGSVSVRIPVVDGARLRLSVRLGRLEHRTTLKAFLPQGDVQPGPYPGPFKPPAGATGPTGATGPGAAPTGSSCPTEGTTSATAELGRAAAGPGEEVSYRVTNTGTRCIVSGVGHSWERQTASGWEPAQPEPPEAFPAVAVQLPPKRSVSGSATVPKNFAPGHYRLVVDAARAAGATPPELDVLAGRQPCAAPTPESTSASLAFAPHSVATPSGPADLELTDTGATCIRTVSVRWQQQQADGTWADTGDAAIGDRRLPAQGRLFFTAQPNDLKPGRHRVLLTYSYDRDGGPASAADPAFAASAEFVLAQPTP